MRESMNVSFRVTDAVRISMQNQLVLLKKLTVNSDNFRADRILSNDLRSFDTVYTWKLSFRGETFDVPWDTDNSLGLD